MAVTHNFRSALGGFNREDVVHYIEYLNSKHTAQVNQLTTEVEELRKKLEAAATVKEDPIWEEKYHAIAEELEAEKAHSLQLSEDAASLRSQLEKALEEHSAAENIAQQELEAYRRAERAERVAKERAEQIYQQATGTLAQATTQVDHAACQITAIIDQVNSHLADLQTAVDDSKCSLLDAAATMAAIRPDNLEEE